ncbi:hypothetical protein PCANC_01222 [Puccinia coronata f. sp. avenae]|uniref:Peptidase M50B-like-domain-containing protein n=1 Tax=Puccinia coronata f. sp. avenae TaxID=200324 RepID=A0A2N5THL0_9BASI|nr:hypothetical protein PCASD_23471 [Puccinia coronata f. sp. avenae]PLW56834.1 hypothetical protein PCANC_01222 [Puccinia coronata f. sp. avenae]
MRLETIPLISHLLLLIPRAHTQYHYQLTTTPTSNAHLPLNTAVLKKFPKPSHSHSPHPPAALPQPSQPPLPHHHHQQVLQKRAPTWTTVTVFVNTITSYAGAPPIVTITVNATDQSPQLSTTTVTVGAYTQTIAQSSNGPQPPQTTSTHTVFLSHPQTTSTTPPAPQATAAPSVPGPSLPADRPCSPGEASERYPGVISLTRPTQTTTLLVMALYLLLMLVCWNLFLVRQLIFPLKLVVISWHELGHVIVSIFVGRTIEEVQIDPSVGGSTKLIDEMIAPAVPLFAGYLSSCLFGGLMVFCGFDTLASKIASIFIAMSFLGVMWWANSITSKILTTAALGLLVAFWFIDHAGMLRYYVLLMGVLSCWYVLFDVMDDFVFRKLNPCCPILFEQRWPKMTAPQWTLIWVLYSAINFAGWVLMSIAVWRQTPRGMFCQSQQFLPT